MNLLILFILSIFIGLGIDTFYPSRKNLNSVKIILFTFASGILGGTFLSYILEKNIFSLKVDIQLLALTALISVSATYTLKKKLSELEL